MLASLFFLIDNSAKYWSTFLRGVAQPGSALAWGARGRRFKSCRPDQKRGEMNSHLLSILVCPNCKSRLDFDKEHQKLICNVDKLSFDIIDDIPVLCVNKAHDYHPDDS